MLNVSRSKHCDTAQCSSPQRLLLTLFYCPVSLHLCNGTVSGQTDLLYAYIALHSAAMLYICIARPRPQVTTTTKTTVLVVATAASTAARQLCQH
jgi:hypothetical protein